MKKRAIGFILLILCAITAHAEEFSWPQQLTTDSGAEAIIYQPQIEAFSGNSIEGRAAVSVKSDATNGVPVFGAIWFRAKIDTDRDARTALIRDMEVSDVRFADATDEQKQQLASYIENSIESSTFTFSVDQMLTDLQEGPAGSAEANFKHEAPEIVLSTEPALLVLIDGKPKLEKI